MPLYREPSAAAYASEECRPYCVFGPQGFIGGLCCFNIDVVLQKLVFQICVECTRDECVKGEDHVCWVKEGVSKAEEFGCVSLQKYEPDRSAGIVCLKAQVWRERRLSDESRRFAHVMRACD